MKLTAKDVMNVDVISVPSDMDLRDLAKMFLDKGITGAPVVDAKGELAGVISQTDLVYYSMTRGDELVLDTQFYHHARFEGQHMPQGYQIEDFNSGTVSDVMTPIVHSVSERASLGAVAKLMTREHIHRVIVRRGRKVAGIISALDVLLAATGTKRAEATPKAAGGAKKTMAAVKRP